MRVLLSLAAACLVQLSGAVPITGPETLIGGFTLDVVADAPVAHDQLAEVLVNELRPLE